MSHGPQPGRSARTIAFAGLWIGWGLLSLLTISAAETAGTTTKASAGACPAGAIGSTRHGAWLCQETANFQVWTPGSHPAPEKLAAACETLRGSLRDTWLLKVGDERGGAETWSPKCVVVLHGDMKAYQR